MLALLAHPTRAEWFAAEAMAAFRESQAAALAGDASRALRYLERAHRIAPDDPALQLALAAARLTSGAPGLAADLLERLVAHRDIREAWFMLAAARQAQRDPTAADSLHHALAGHALPVDGYAALADAICAATGQPGWCGLAPDRRLLFRQLAPGPLHVTCDGRPLRRPWATPPLGQRVEFRIAGRPLLGSPLHLADIRAIDGLVATHDGGLEGWAWHPRDPDRNPILRITTRSGRLLHRLVADDTAMPAPAPLARPRRFAVPAGLPAGPLRVTSAHGQALRGSPLDPGQQHRADTVAARAVRAANPFPTGATPGPSGTIAVVVPVHGNPELTLDCLARLAATAPKGTPIIVIDDASPEPTLIQALDTLHAQRRITLLRHIENRGFPASANAGMRAAARLPGGPDILLLNSDTRPTRGLLPRLRAAVHAHADIGTATPFSNDATIMSYPDLTQPAPAPAGPALARLARQAARANPGLTVDLPTGVGCCLYIRRECLAAVGLFREDCFAQGYGEENDLCLRATALGWRHIGVPGAYVAHVGGQSFGGQSFGTSGAALRDRNLAVLERLHPGYHARIAAFQQADPLAEARRRLDAARWRADRVATAVILITHDSGGGVERVIQARAAALRRQGIRPILLRPTTTATHLTDPEGNFPNLRFTLPTDLAALARLLHGDRPTAIEVHHLLGHHHAILTLADRLAVPLAFHLHDYAMLCPRITLMGRDARYCGEPDLDACEHCIADLGDSTGEAITVAALRDRSRRELADATITVPSPDMARRLRRYFPALRPTPLPPENDADLPPLTPTSHTTPTRICVVGGLSGEKGYDILLACARDAATRHLPLTFTLVGHTAADARLLATNRVFVTGPYDDADVVALIRAQSAQLGWLPSVWPETWCFTLSHLWRAGLAVAAFDIGAPADRIRATDRGWLMPLGLSAGAINEAFLKNQAKQGRLGAAQTRKEASPL